MGRVKLKFQNKRSGHLAMEAHSIFMTAERVCQVIDEAARDMGRSLELQLAFLGPAHRLNIIHNEVTVVIDVTEMPGHALPKTVLEIRWSEGTCSDRFAQEVAKRLGYKDDVNRRFF